MPRWSSRLPLPERAQYGTRAQQFQARGGVPPTKGNNLDGDLAESADGLHNLGRIHDNQRGSDWRPRSSSRAIARRHVPSRGPGSAQYLMLGHGANAHIQGRDGVQVSQRNAEPERDLPRALTGGDAGDTQPLV